MANEWIPIELYGPNGDGGKTRLTIANGVSVSIGAALQLLDPRTASYSHLAKVALGGISSEEHVADKGNVSISVWTDGLFDAVCSGAVTLGDYVLLSLQYNKVQSITAPDIASGALELVRTLGRLNIRAFETGSDGETINVRLKL